MNIWDEFECSKKKLFEFVNARKVVLWGYEYNGFFIQHLFETANKRIEYIVDDGNISPKILIYRSCELYEINPIQYVVVISGENNNIIEQFLEKKGFRLNRDYIYAVDLFQINVNKGIQLSYFGYLESKYCVDITARKTPDVMETPNEECLMYSPGIGYGLVNVLNELAIKEEDSMFDFGCGKGGALVLFKKHGFRKIGGVEYDSQLFSVLIENFEKLGIENNGLINGDASLISTELDDYNYFFMYNPFVGDTFYKVICNIEKSWERRSRKIIMIYSGPYCHELVIKNNKFHLTKKIYTDYSVRNVYVYTIPEEIYI